MNITNESRAIGRLRVSLASVVVAVTVLVLTGYAAGVERLRNGLAGEVPVRPNAAVALLCLGLALLVRHAGVARVLGAVAAAIGAATAAQWATGADFGIDTLLFDGEETTMRMSVPAAAASSLAGAAILASRRRPLGQALGAATAFIAVLSVVAYLYDARLLPGAAVAPVALSTAILLTLWSIAYLIGVSDSGPLTIFLGDDQWARFARRTGALTLVAPVMLGALSIVIARTGVYDVRFAAALIVTTTTFILFGASAYLIARMEAVYRTNDEARRISDARFRRLYDANAIGVAFVDKGGVVIEANDEILRIFGVPRSEIPGWRWREHDTPDGELAERTAMEELRATGRSATIEKECLRRDGERIWVQVTAAELDAGRDIAFVSDVTERVEAQRTLQRAHDILAARVAMLEGVEAAKAGETATLVQERAQVEVLARRLAAATEELETFSYSVSHDLRAPLRAIDGFSRELMLRLDAKLDEDSSRYLTRIRAATQRMSRLIDDLLDLSRLSRRAMNRSKVDVSALAAEVANELGASHVAVQPGLTALADPHLLRVVLQNLIGNAMKFSSRREKPEVEVFAAGDGAIAVRDNGVGFDMQYAPKIFAPFQRLHPSSQFEGTGIGLALVQRIVARHGGSIRAESAPDQGATFYLTLGEAQP